MNKSKRRMLESREKRRSTKRLRELETSESLERRLKKKEEKERDSRKNSGRRINSKTSLPKLNFLKPSSMLKMSPARSGSKELLLKMLKELDSRRDRKKMKENPLG